MPLKFGGKCGTLGSLYLHVWNTAWRYKQWTELWNISSTSEIIFSTWRILKNMIKKCESMWEFHPLNKLSVTRKKIITLNAYHISKLKITRSCQYNKWFYFDAVMRPTCGIWWEGDRKSYKLDLTARCWRWKLTVAGKSRLFHYITLLTNLHLHF